MKEGPLWKIIIFFAAWHSLYGGHTAGVRRWTSVGFLPEVQDRYYLNGTLVTAGEQQWQPDTQTIRLSDEKQITAQTYSCEELLALAQEW